MMQFYSKFTSDKVSVRGPRVDGTWVISFEVGEYEKEAVSELVKSEGNLYIYVTNQKPDPEV